MKVLTTTEKSNKTCLQEKMEIKSLLIIIFIYWKSHFSLVVALKREDVVPNPQSIVSFFANLHLVIPPDTAASFLVDRLEMKLKLIWTYIQCSQFAIRNTMIILVKINIFIGCTCTFIFPPFFTLVVLFDRTR